MSAESTTRQPGAARGLDEFRAFYATDLLPILEELEARRKQGLARVGKVALVLLVAAVGAVALASFAPGALPLILIAVGIAIVVTAAMWMSFAKDLRGEFKRRVVAEVARFVDPSLYYAPERHVSKDRFRDSGIFQHSIDRFRGEDYVSGTIGRTQIEFSELHAQYKTTTHTKNGTHTTWHTIFRGLFFVADFNKHFRGRTFVLTDVAESTLGFLGRKLQEINFTRPDLVRLEDPEFERTFVVYSDDQIEARYILSTSLMARILDFRRRTGRAVQLSFVHSNVHVAIPMTRNMFEPRMARPLVDFGLVRQFLHDLQFACGIVDELNLNTRIWSKE